jgi:hypothetical protein
MLHPGAHQEDHWALEYGPPSSGDGYWETVQLADLAYGPSYRRAVGHEAELRFAYSGGDVTLVPGPGQGVVEVSVDGDAPRRMSLNGRPARLAGPGPVGRFLNRDQGVHTVTLRRLEGELGVDGLLVSNSSAPWVWLAVPIGLLVLVAVWLLTRMRLSARSLSS